MDKYRFQLSTLLYEAKHLYQMQHDYQVPSLLYLSSSTGLTTSNLSKIFSGVQIPTLLNFLKICDALETRIDLAPFDLMAAHPELFQGDYNYKKLNQNG